MAKIKRLTVNKNIPQISVSFTPEYYKRAFKQYQYGDYSYLIALFERAEIDSFIGGCLTARTAGYKKKWAITPADESAQANDIAEWIQEVLNNLGIRTLFDEIISAKMKRFNVAGLTWDIVDGKVVPVELTHFDPKYFKYDKDGILKINFTTELRDIPPDSAVVTEFKKIPIFLKVLKDFIRKEFGEDNWSSFIENFGDPFILGT